MENTITLVVISLICVLAHIPSLLLRIVPFHDKMSDKSKYQLSAIYLTALLSDFVICMIKGMNGGITVPFYKLNLILFCIAMAFANVRIVRGFTREHLFVFGIVANIVMITLAIGAYISTLLGFGPDGIGIAQTSVIGIIIYALLYPLLARLMRYTVRPFLDIDCKDYWNTVWLIPIAMFFASIFSYGAGAYTATFLQMLSKCMIGVATLMLCIAIAHDHQRFHETEQLNQQIDQQKGYYNALTEQVLREREARHNFRHQVAAIRGFLETDDLQGLYEYCDDLELEQVEKVDIPYTGNAAADGVLYYYGCQAKAKNIKFSVCCQLKKLSISDQDLCIILGNALDNAVTAAGSYEGERYIEVLSEKKHDMLLLTVDNSFDGILLQEKGKIYSKKRAKGEEGIGILSIRKLCEKNGGASKFEADGNHFQASFLLKNLYVS